MVMLFFMTLIGYFILLGKILGDWTDRDIALKFFSLITVSVPPSLLAAL